MMPFLVSRMPSLVNASVAVLPLTHHLQKKKSTVPIFSDENNMTMEVARYCKKKKNDLGHWRHCSAEFEGNAPTADPPHTRL